MTRDEWLTSADPAAMLRARSAEWDKGESYSLIPDRLLRLFACACCRAAWPNGTSGDRFLLAVDQLERAANTEPFVANALIDEYFHPDWSAQTLAEWAARRVPMTAHLLRDIVGDPWSEIVLTRTVLCDRCNGKGQRTLGRECGACEGTGKTKGNADWLTPEAVAIARDACERRGRGCKECKGRGSVRQGGIYASRHDRDECGACHGTGRIDDGALDPGTLGVLADCLEDAGAADPPGRTAAQVLAARANAVMGGCCDRWADRQPCGCLADTVPEGLLAHLRSPGPHVVGCWAVRLVLGEG